MNKEIISFRFNDAEVRTIMKNNEPWFVLSDVLSVLEIKRKPAAVVGRLDDDVRQTYPILDSLGRTQNTHIVSEAGLYDVIVRSDAPKTKKFRRWVTHEVLPSIRKHGGYMAGQEQMTPEEMALASFKWLQSKVTEQQKQLEAQAPKVLFADSVATSHTSILIGELAKILKGNGVNIGQNRLFAYMRDKGYLCKQKGDSWNSPTQKSMEMGLFRVKETTSQQPDGSVRINRTTKVTGKGQQYFINKLLKEKEGGF